MCRLWQAKKKRDEHEPGCDEPVNNNQNPQEIEQPNIAEQPSGAKSNSAPAGSVLGYTLVALFLLLIVGAVTITSKEASATVEPTSPPTPDSTLLEPYKDYLIAYSTAGASTIADRLNAENAIRNCNTVRDVESCSFITPMFSSEMVLTYDAWLVAGMPAPNDVTLVVTTPSNIRSGPGTDYSIIDTADTGETLVKVDKLNDWYRVVYNGQIGYIFGELVVPM